MALCENVDKTLKMTKRPLLSALRFDPRSETSRSGDRPLFEVTGRSAAREGGLGDAQGREAQRERKVPPRTQDLEPASLQPNEMEFSGERSESAATTG